MSDEESVQYDEDDYNEDEEDEDEYGEGSENEDEDEDDEDNEESKVDDEEKKKNPKPRIAFAQYPGDIILSMNKFCKVSIAQKEDNENKNEENIQHIITISTSQPGEVSQQLQLTIKDGMCLINQQIGEYVPPINMNNNNNNGIYYGNNNNGYNNYNNYNGNYIGPNGNNYNVIDNNNNNNMAPMHDDLSNIRPGNNMNYQQQSQQRLNGQVQGFSATLNNNVLNPSMQFDLTPSRSNGIQNSMMNSNFNTQTTMGMRFNNGVGFSIGQQQRDPKDFYRNTHAVNSVLNK